MKKHYLLLSFLFFFPLNLHSESQDASRSERINLFKTNMECVNAARSAEDWAKLVPCTKKALELLENLFDPNHPNVAAMTHQYGIALNTHGGYQAESEQVLKSAIKKCMLVKIKIPIHLVCSIIWILHLTSLVKMF